MADIKVITLCGSSRFDSKFKEVELLLTRKGFAVLMPIFRDRLKLNKNDIKLFGRIHLKKITLADEIFVMDVDGYIGESTKKEIEYAKSKNKIIRYYSEEM